MKNLFAIALIAHLALVACEKKDPGTTPPASTSSAPAGGSQSIPGKARDMAKDVAEKATEKSAEVAKTAETAAAAAGDAWQELRATAVKTAQEKLAGLQAKITGLKDSNPALFASLGELAKKAGGKISELGAAGSDKWQALSKEVTDIIANIQGQLPK